MHIFGHFAKNFNQREKDAFIEIVQQFKEENISIGRILAEIEPLIYKYDNTYLAKQTYFLLYADPEQKIKFSHNEKKLPLVGKFITSYI